MQHWCLPSKSLEPLNIIEQTKTPPKEKGGPQPCATGGQRCWSHQVARCGHTGLDLHLGPPFGTTKAIHLGPPKPKQMVAMFFDYQPCFASTACPNKGLYPPKSRAELTKRFLHRHAKQKSLRKGCTKKKIPLVERSFFFFFNRYIHQPFSNFQKGTRSPTLSPPPKKKEKKVQDEKNEGNGG